MIKYPINNYGGVPEELRNGDWLPLLNSVDIEQNPVNGQPILTATGVVPGTYGDAFNVAQFTVDDKGRIHFAGNVPLAAAAGTVSNFTFTDGDGFDGTVLTATTTPVLSLKTTLTQGSVVFISPTKGITEDNAAFFWNNTTKRLAIGSNTPIFALDVTGTAYAHNTFVSTSQGGYAAYFNNVATIPAGMSFGSGYTWAGGISTNTVQFGGTTTITPGAIIAGHTASNSIEFTAAGLTVTMGQASGFRALSGFQILSRTAGINSGTVSHGASLQIQGVYPASAAVVTFQNYYGILINQLDEWGVVSFTNKWGIYQQGANDPNYFGGRVQIGNVSNQGGHNLQVTGGFYANVTSSTMRFVGLTTDNTATQVLAKNTAGDNVWRDQSSIVGATPYLQSTQIAFGSGSNAMTSSVGLTYYNSTVTVAPSLVSGAFRTQSTIIQSTGTGLGWYGQNVYYNSNFRNYDVGAGGILAFSGTEFHIRMFPSVGSTDNDLSGTIGTYAQYKTDSTGMFAIGGLIPIASGNVTGASISGDAAGNIKIKTVAQDDTKTAVMVWDATDKIVRWRNASTLITAPDTHALLSAIHTDTVAGAPVLGALIVGNATAAWDRLLGQTTATKKFLSQTGTGVISGIPVWDNISGGDVAGAALTKTDDTNVTLTLGGTPANALLRATSITVGWQGTLAVTRGGTGIAAVAQGDLLFGSAPNTYSILNKSATPNQYLKNSGASNNPAWASITLADVGVTAAALTRTNDTNITLTLGGSPNTALLAATSITVGWTGTLAPTRGGTGITTYVLGDIIYASAANVLSKLAGNITTGKLFLSQTGTGTVSAAPVWASMAGSDITGAALTKTDDTNVTLTLSGTPATALLRATGIAVGWTGTLAVTRGGTGLAAAAQGDILYASAANTYSLLNKSIVANQFLKNSGTSNNPVWASIQASDIGIGAALTKTDDTNVTLTLGGTPSAALLAATSITVGWTGTLSIARGGTAISTYTTGDILYASATNVLSKLAGNITTVKQFLSQTGSGAASAAPVWASITLADIGTMATARILGRVTAGTGVVEQLTGTQATTLMDLFSTTTTTKGVVPGSNNVGSTFFLRADGTWAVPPGAGGGGYTTLSQFVDETAWRMYYSNAAGDITPFALGTANQVLQSTGVSAAPTWVTIGSGTIGGSLAATQVAYGSAANTITGSANFIFTNGTGTLTLNTATGKLIQLGDTTAAAIANPVAINMGGSHSSVAATNLKLLLFDNGLGVTAGFGISNAQMEYVSGAGIIHHFYQAGVHIVSMDTTQIGIYGSGQIGWENTVGQKMNFYGGPGGGAGGYNMGVASSDLYHNVPSAAKHGFRVNGAEWFNVGGASGVVTTTTTIVNPAAIGSFIVMAAGQTGDSIQIRSGSTNVFRVDAGSHIHTYGDLILREGNNPVVYLGYDRASGYTTQGLWFITDPGTAAYTNANITGGTNYTFLNAGGVGAYVGLTIERNLNDMVKWTNGQFTIGIPYNGAGDLGSKFYMHGGPMVINANTGPHWDFNPILVLRTYASGTDAVPEHGPAIEFRMYTGQSMGGTQMLGGQIGVHFGADLNNFDFKVKLSQAAAAPTEKFRVKSTGEIVVQTLTQNDALTKVAVWDDTSKLIKWRSAATFGSGTIAGSIAATQVAFGSAANTITGDAAFTYAGGKLTIAQPLGNALYLGTSTQVGTTTPVTLNLGGTYSTVEGANPKIIFYDDGPGGASMGFTSTNDLYTMSRTTLSSYIGSTKMLMQTNQTFHLMNSNILSFDNSGVDKISFLWGQGLKISVYSPALRYNVDTGWNHSFTVNAVSIFQVHASGATSPGTGIDSERLGLNSAAGDYGTAFGRSTNSSSYSVSMGWSSNAAGALSVAIGYGAYTNPGHNVAIGYNARATESYAIAIGKEAQSVYYSGVAIGTLAYSSGGIAIGYSTTATTRQFVVGSSSTNGEYTEVYFGSGVASATPFGFTIYGSYGIGTDIAGPNIAMAGGRGSGAGTPGNILFYVSEPLASGSTVQTLYARLTVGRYGIQPYMANWSIAPPGAAGYIQYNQINNAMYYHDSTTWRYFLASGNGAAGLQTALRVSNGLKWYYDGTYNFRWEILLGDNYSWSGEPNIGTAALGSWRYIPLNGQRFGFTAGTNESHVFANFVGHGMTIGNGQMIPDSPILRVGGFDTTARSGWWNPVSATGPGTLAHFYSPPMTYGNASYPHYSIVTIENDQGPDPQTANVAAIQQNALTVLLRINTQDPWQTPNEWIAIRAAAISVTGGGGAGGLHLSRMYAIKATAGRIYSQDGIQLGSKTADEVELAYAGYMTFRSDTGKYRVHNGTGWRNLAYEGALVTPWRIFYSDGTGAMTELAFGSGGQVLQSNGSVAAPSWVTPAGGGGGTPGGPNTSVQFNNSGIFGGSSAFTWDGQRVTVAGSQSWPSYITGTLFLQSYSLGNSWIAENAYHNAGGGGWFNSGTAGGGVMQFTSDEVAFRLFPSQPAGTLLTSYMIVSQLRLTSSGMFGIGGNITSTAGTMAGAFLSADGLGNIAFKTVAQDDTQTKVLMWDSATTVLKWRSASTLGGSGSTLAATYVGYGSGTNTVTGSSDMTFTSGQLTLNKNGGTNIQLGTITSAPSTDPVRIRMGASHSSVAGANPKIILYEDGTYLLGLGISSSQLDYIVPATMGHHFYVDTARVMSITNTNLNIYATIAVSSIPLDNTKTGILTWDGSDKIIRYRDVSTISTSLTATYVGYGSGTNTVTGDTNMTYVSGTLKLNKTQGSNLTLGSITPVQSTTPVSINLGGSSSSTPGANLKILLYDDGSLKAGFGISGNGSDYVAYIHTFYTIDAVQRVHINDTQIGILGAMQIGWENVIGQRMNFYGFPSGGANGYNMGVDTNILWWNVPTAASHIFRIQAVNAFAIGATGVSIATVSQDDALSSIMVWDSGSKLVKWRSAASLATGGSSTKFGKAGEDATAAETRAFALGTFNYSITSTTATSNSIVFVMEDVTGFHTETRHSVTRWWVDSYTSESIAGQEGFIEVSGEVINPRVLMFAADNSIDSATEVTIKPTGLYIEQIDDPAVKLNYVFKDMIEAVGTKTLRYDPSTGAITYHDIPTGGGAATPPASPANSVQFNNAGAFGGSANLTWDGTTLSITSAATVAPTLKIGSITIQPYTLNNAWFGENAVYNGSQFINPQTGGSALFYFVGGEGQFRFSASQAAGNPIASFLTYAQFKMDAAGQFALGMVPVGVGSFSGSLYGNSSGQIMIGTVAQDNAKTNILTWDATDKVIRWRAASSLVASSAISALTAATVANDINNGSWTQTWRWNSLGIGAVGTQGLWLQSNAASDRTTAMIAIIRGGSSTAGLTRGIDVTVNATGPANVGIEINAVNATSNIALKVSGGDVYLESLTQDVEQTKVMMWGADKLIKWRDAATFGSTMGYTSTVTTGGTTTLNSTSTYYQYFTGVATQIIVTPDVTTLTLGKSWEIVNLSSLNITVRSSGAVDIIIIVPGASAIITCISLTGSGNGSWRYNYHGALVATGEKLWINNSMQFVGPGGAASYTFPATDTIVGIVAVQTLTNKRITPRLATVANTISLTINSDTTDLYTVTAMNGTMTINNPSGTPTDGQKLMLRIKSDASARTLSWTGSQWRSGEFVLPTTTTPSRTMYLGFIWNAADSKWDLIAYTDNYT